MVMQETINVVVTMNEKVSKPVARIQAGFNKLSEGMKHATGAGAELTTSYSRLSNLQQQVVKDLTAGADVRKYSEKSMREQGRQMTTVTDNYIKFTGVAKKNVNLMKDMDVAVSNLGTSKKGLCSGTIRLNSVTKSATRTFERFHMELLGIMFFGMAMQRMFGQHVMSTLQMIGVTDMFSIGIQMLVLEALLPFNDEMYTLLGHIFELDPAIKALLGTFIIFMAVMGFTLFMIGQMGLGAGSLVAAWGKLTAAMGTTTFGQTIIAVFKAIIGWIARLIVRFAPLLLALFLVYQGFKERKDQILGIVNEIWIGINHMIGYAISFIISAFRLLGALLTGDTEKAKTCIAEMIVAIRGYIFSMFVEVIANFGRFLGEILLGIAEYVGKIKQKVIDFFTWLIFGSYIPDAFTETLSQAKTFMTDIWNAVVGKLEKLKKEVTDIVDGLKKKLGSVGGGVKDVGSSIISHIPGLASGGIVTSPTLAMIGEGGPEAVIPLRGRGRGGLGGNSIVFSPTINIESTITHDVDIDDLKRRLSDEWVRELERMVRQVR